MRAGLSTIQQTLTPEAASVLKRSIAEAARRNHGQTTSLHVAATLLAAPSCLLRQACARSHPQSSHPLQCRALELCFSVALDRLPASNPGPSSVEPPISNALMAALKRAQANQRRGCPEQQQQPLLAVKVELEQLVISILDDPSVSRVMREASFSSVAVKAAVEHSISTSSSSSVSPAAASAPSVGSLATATTPPTASGFLGLSNRVPRCHNLYINPRLHQHQGSDGAASTTIIGSVADQPREDEVNRVLDILSRPKKRNPILVGDCNPDAVMREVLQRIQSSNAPPKLHNAQVLPFSKEIAAAAHSPSQIAIKIGELSCSIESLGGERGVILDLGDLKWLVESHSVSMASGPIHPPKAIVSEAGRAAVEEMGKLLKKFQYGHRLWVVGTAASATYLRCQVYHPTMESDWDLQVVPLAPRSSPTTMLQRFGGCHILSSSVEKLAPTKGFAGMCDSAMPLRRSQESINPLQRKTLCPSCLENYERELANLITGESKKNSTKQETSQGLPQWLQIAKLSSEGSTNSASAPVKPKVEEQHWNQSTEELLKRWTETCSRLHSNFHLSQIRFEMPLIPSLSKPTSMIQQNSSSAPKLSISTRLSLNQLESNQVTDASEKPTSPSRSHVRTDLVLSNSEVSNSSLDMTYNDQHMPNVAGISDIDLFKRVSKGLLGKVSWQQEAASAIASAVMQCRSGTGKRRTVGTKGDTWLLLFGPDKVGKRKMATVLSELMFGTGPTIVKLGRASCTDCNDGESYFSHRGRTIMDRVVEAVRQNPLSVIVLEDIDQADILLKSKIKQAIERGRLADSHGGEVSLGSVIFVLTADWLPEELKSSYSSILQDEEKMLDLAYSGVELELSTENKRAKRSPDWVCDNNQPVKLRKECSIGTGLSLDLNLAVGIDIDAGEGSGNSSDLTTDHECDKGRLAVKYSTSSLASELADLVDEAIMLKPVDFGLLRRNVMQSALAKFASLMGEGREVRIDDDAIDRIVAGVWFSRAAFDEWAEKVLIPSLKQLRSNLRSDSGVVVRLSTIKGDRRVQSNVKDCLPTKVAVAINGANDNP